MASPTPNKGFTYPAHGGAVNAWDTPLNTDFDAIDTCLGGSYKITLSSTIAGATFNSTNATISSTVASIVFPSSIALNLMYDVSGTITQATALTYPAVGAIYYINNASSGAFSLSARTAALTASVTIPQGGASFVLTSGSDAITNTNNVAVPILRSQMQTENINTLMGNLSTAVAVPQEITFGTGLTTNSTTQTLSAPGYAPPSSHRALVIKVATNTTVTVTADYVTMTDGTNYATLPVSGTCDLGSNGAVNRLDAGSIATSKWYNMFAIYNGTTVGTLASLSATAPTLPAGYTYFARIGAVTTSTSVAQLMGTWQYGNVGFYVVGLAQTTNNLPVIASGATGTVSVTDPSLTATTVRGNGFYVPPTAYSISVLSWNSWRGGAGGGTQAAPSASYTGAGKGPTASPNGTLSPIVNNFGVNAGENATFFLESDSIYFAGSAGSAVQIQSWVDNI